MRTTSLVDKAVEEAIRDCAIRLRIAGRGKRNGYDGSTSEILFGGLLGPT